MSQYNNVSNLLHRALEKAGEVTTGTSDYQETILDYVNDVHRALCAGGTVFETAVDEVWPWARSQNPMVITLLPKYNSGSVSLTQGTNAGAFSGAPASSLQGWFLRVAPETSERATYRILSHAAGGTAFILDGAFLGTTNGALSYEAFKLDYDLFPDYIQITTDNNKLDFSANGNTQLTATLTPGSYTPAALATEAGNQLTAADSGPNTYTGSYNPERRLFTLTSDLSDPGSVFQLWGSRGTNALKSGLGPLGFNSVQYTDRPDYAGVYALGGISRLIEPVRVYGKEANYCELNGVDPLTFGQLHYPGYSEQGTPTAFCKIAEDSYGKVTLRLNAFPDTTMRMEVEYVPVPRDLQNSEASFPLLPVKYFPLLEYAGVYFVLLEKEDSKAEQYLSLARTQLTAMQKHFRAEERRIGPECGQITPRSGNAGPWFRRLRYGYDKWRY